MFSYVLIVVGLILVAVSFFVSEKIDKGLLDDAEPVSTPQEIWTDKEEKKVKERIDTILSDKTDEAVVRVDDQLSLISNEKIMAVNDFSDQLLEKINENHKEVVFLYNMLGEKEEEIKKLMATPLPKPEPIPVPEYEPNPAKQPEAALDEGAFEEGFDEEELLAEDIEDKTVDEDIDGLVEDITLEETKEEVVKKSPSELLKVLEPAPKPEIKAPMSGFEMVAAMAAAAKEDRGRVAAEASAQAKETARANEEQQKRAKEEALRFEAEKKAIEEKKAAKKVPAQAQSLVKETASKQAATQRRNRAVKTSEAQSVAVKKEAVEKNRNEQILSLYEKGNSILEISKALGIGQGEVKLVIDLFQGVGR
jgi:hypothetical protein